MKGDGGALAAAAVATERAGFARMCAALARAAARDMARGAISSDYLILIEHRVAAMIDQVELGLHITGARPLDDPDPAATAAPLVGGGR